MYEETFVGWRNVEGKDREVAGIAGNNGDSYRNPPRDRARKAA